MNVERDKFLTAVMGECLHEWQPYKKALKCSKCSKTHTYPWQENFATWDGLGKLWEWAQEQEWFGIWQGTCYGDEDVWGWDGDVCYLKQRYIHPDRFADAVYEFLKRREP